MKQKLLILITVLFVSFTLAAQERGRKPNFSKEEFKEKLESFLIKQAELTESEAAKFFPIYSECQEQKRKYNDQIWDLRKKAFKQELSEDEYKNILERIAELRIQIEELDKAHIAKYHSVLSYKKIFSIQSAETRFHRELLKNINQPRHNDSNNNRRREGNK